MSGHEKQPPPEQTLSRQEKEHLLQQMYGLPHWIAIIRLFAHKTLSMDVARAALKPIAEEFGKDKAAAASEVLVEIVPGKEPIARLKSHIKRMAFQIIGPETTEEKPATPPPAPMDGIKTAPAEGKPVKQPRHFVLKQCEAWLRESKLAFVAMNDVKCTTPAAGPYLGSLDFVVLRADEKLLVTVRPHLQKKHLVAIGELQKLYGPEYRPVRLWPVDAPEGWRWQEHSIELSADPA